MPDDAEQNLRLTYLEAEMEEVQELLESVIGQVRR